MEMHERVRYLRTVILHNMSQTEFASILGSSRDEINNIECNRLRRPEQKKSLLKLMSEKFNVSEKWIVDGEGDPAPEIGDPGADYVSELLDDDENPLSPIIKSIMKAYSDLPQKDKDAVKKFAQSFTENMQKESRD